MYLILPITQLLQNPSISPPSEEPTLPRHRLLQSRRPTDAHFHPFCPRAWQRFLEQLLRDVSLFIFAVGLCVAHNVFDLKLFGLCAGPLIKFLLEEYVIFGVIPKDEGHFRFVGGVVEDSARKLIHGCDACAASNQDDVGVLVGLPGVGGKGATGRDSVARGKGVNVRGSLAMVVALNHER